MNNADMPAMPLTEDQIDRSERGNGYEGLTKREYFAGLSMQGLLADSVAAEGKGYDVSQFTLASDAVAHADALLAELEKTK